MTDIQWVKNKDGSQGKTWNIVTGCTPISDGCTHCYAKRIAETMLRGRYGYPVDDPFRVTFHPEKLKDSLSWKKPQTVFVCSMGDLFHENVPFWMINSIFETMITHPQHKYLILTKRPQRLYEWADSTNAHLELIHPHIWLGVSCENQQRANERIPILLQIPAAVRFVSIEPCLGDINLNLCHECQADPDQCHEHNKLDWVILGGETGPGARSMHPNWVRSIRDQCVTANVPFFFKSWGAYGSAMINMSTGYEVFKMFPNKQKWVQKGDTWINGGVCIDLSGKIIRYGEDFDAAEYPVAVMHKVKKSGNELDGQIWNQMPEECLRNLGV
uniref:Phage protein Gp37/Gp68 n=1 Tax=viral metagenome TaxID=1070528 RepID=A0A6M3IYR3_9ZZZZ